MAQYGRSGPAFGRGATGCDVAGVYRRDVLGPRPSRQRQGAGCRHRRSRQRETDARPNRDVTKPPPSGNPLWSIPLSTLSATQERPIFSASRRPPPRAVAAPPVEQVSVPPPTLAAAPEPPPLALIGAVVGDSDAIAVFVDRTNQKMVRLRQGESHAGWVLSTVLRREVTLTKDDRTETIELKSTTVPGRAPVLPVRRRRSGRGPPTIPSRRSYRVRRRRTANRTAFDPKPALPL